jgi:hypothetical protein
MMNKQENIERLRELVQYALAELGFQEEEARSAQFDLDRLEIELEDALSDAGDDFNE